MLRFRDQNPTQTSCMCIKARRLIQSPERTCYRCVRRPNERHRLRMLIYPVDEGLGEWGVCFNEVLLPFFLLFDIHWGYFQLAFARVFRENTPRSPRNKPCGQLAGQFASIRHTGGSFFFKIRSSDLCCSDLNEGDGGGGTGFAGSVITKISSRTGRWNSVHAQEGGEHAEQWRTRGTESLNRPNHWQRWRRNDEDAVSSLSVRPITYRRDTIGN